MKNNQMSWECVKCGSVYPVWKDKCDHCYLSNVKYETVTGYTTDTIKTK